MRVNRHQWYVRWFLWNCTLMDQFLNRDLPHTRANRAMSRGTDLCTFFRTILVGTLIALINAGFWLYLVGVFFVAPFLLFNITTVAMSVGLIVGILVAAVAVVAVVVAAPEAVKWARRKATPALNKAPDQAPTFLQVAWRYVVSVKQRFCPTITIQEKNLD